VIEGSEAVDHDANVDTLGWERRSEVVGKGTVLESGKAGFGRRGFGRCVWGRAGLELGLGVEATLVARLILVLLANGAYGERGGCGCGNIKGREKCVDVWAWGRCCRSMSAMRRTGLSPICQD